MGQALRWGFGVLAAVALLAGVSLPVPRYAARDLGFDRQELTASVGDRRGWVWEAGLGWVTVDETPLVLASEHPRGFDRASAEGGSGNP